jgi:hypothetical protein
MVLWSCWCVDTWAVSIPDLLLVVQVGVELVFEVVYVGLEFFMLADLVVSQR